jgi:outer membrane protein assembly factor BamE (lipoprotein component of BamABCDE complex)
MRKAVLALVLVGVATLPACTRIQNASGYIVDETLVTAIQPGVDNRDSVAKTLGRPSIASQWDDKQWYYVSRNTKQLAFLTPRPSSQSIVVVNFDAAGNVAGVERRGLEKVASIDPVDDETPTLGRESGILEDLFGNIGRFGGAPAGNAPPQ